MEGEAHVVGALRAEQVDDVPVGAAVGLRTVALAPVVVPLHGNQLPFISGAKSIIIGNRVARAARAQRRRSASNSPAAMRESG